MQFSRANLNISTLHFLPSPLAHDPGRLGHSQPSLTRAIGYQRLSVGPRGRTLDTDYDTFYYFVYLAIYHYYRVFILMTNNTPCVVGIKTPIQTPPTKHPGAALGWTDLPVGGTGSGGESLRFSANKTLDCRPGSEQKRTAPTTYNTYLNTSIAKMSSTGKLLPATPTKTGTNSQASTPDNLSKMSKSALDIVQTPNSGTFLAGIARNSISHTSKAHLFSLFDVRAQRAENKENFQNHTRSLSGGDGTIDDWDNIEGAEEDELMNETITAPATPLGKGSTPTDTTEASGEDVAKSADSVDKVAPSPTPSHHSIRSTKSDTSLIRRSLKLCLKDKDPERKRESAKHDRKGRAEESRMKGRNISSETFCSAAQPDLIRGQPSPYTVDLPESSVEVDMTTPPNPPITNSAANDDHREDTPPSDQSVPVPGQEAPANQNTGGEACPGTGRTGETGEEPAPVGKPKKKRNRGKRRKGKAAAGTSDLGDVEQGPGRANLAPSDVFGRGDPKATVTITRTDEGGDAHNAVARALFCIPEFFNVLQLRPTTDGARIEVDDPAAGKVIERFLGSQGWTVVTEPVWSRYQFCAPGQLSGHGNGPGLDTATLVRMLVLRNSALWGLPKDGVRLASSAWEKVEVEGDKPSEPSRRRLRVWVDVSPESEKFLAQRGFYLSTLVGAVKLRPAPRSRPRPDRS